MVGGVLSSRGIWYVEEQPRADVENHCYATLRRTNHRGNFELIDGIGRRVLVLGICLLIANPLMISNHQRIFCGIRQDSPARFGVFAALADCIFGQLNANFCIATTP